jgi:predicted membrane protein
MMRNQGQFYLGIVIVVFGIVLLIANIFNIDLSMLCWPMVFILLGLFFIYRPKMLEPGTELTQKFLGEEQRSGRWQVVDEEFWSFVGDVELDMINADIPDGVTKIRMFSFVGDIDLYVPSDVGVMVDATAFVSDVSLPDAKEENFLMPLHIGTVNYKLAQKKILLQATCFVGDIKVRQVG